MKQKSNMQYKLIFLLLNLFIRNPGFSQDATKLEVGDYASHSYDAGKTHHFEISLTKGDFAHINILQRGVDVLITTYGPDENKIEDFDSQNGDNGEELVLIDADKTGNYQIKVEALGRPRKIKKGSYDINYLSNTKDINAHLGGILSKLYARKLLPGFSMNIVNKDSVLYQKSLGYASIKDKVPYTDNKIQNIASISKTFISISLMMLVEEGKLSLDTEINDVLPFQIVNPYHKNTPITIRHLATHTSSIDDFPVYYDKAIFIEDRDALKNKYP